MPRVSQDPHPCGADMQMIAGDRLHRGCHRSRNTGTQPRDSSATSLQELSISLSACQPGCARAMPICGGPSPLRRSPHPTRSHRDPLPRPPVPPMH